MTRLQRPLVALALVGVCFAMGVHAGVDPAYALSDPHPNELATEYGAHVGESSLYFATVRQYDADSDTARIVVGSSHGPVRLTARSFDTAVDPGRRVQVYGTLRPGHVLDTERVVVINPGSSSRTYKYAVSAVGAALVLVAFFRRWTVDVSTLTFEVRTDG